MSKVSQDEGELELVPLTDFLLPSSDAGKESEEERLKKALDAQVAGKTETNSFAFFQEQGDQEVEEEAAADPKQPVTTVTDELETEVESDPPSGDQEVSVEITGNEEGNDEAEFYRSSLKTILGDSVKTIVQEVDGEEVEVSLDDISPDATLYNEILLSHINSLTEEANTGKVSTEGLSPYTQRLIEVEKKGGDISRLKDVQETIGFPIDDIDTSTIEGRKEMIRLRMKSSGQHSDDLIERIIKTYESDDVLEEASDQAEEQMRNALEEYSKAEVKRAEDAAEDRKEKLKVYKKDLRESLAVFELKDTHKAKLVDFATKKEANGRYTMDLAYYEMRNDPKRASELALFFMDKNEYVKQVSKKEVEGSKLESARKLKIVKRDTAGNMGTPAKTKGDEDLLDISAYLSK